MNAYEVTYHPEHEPNHTLKATRFYSDLEQAQRLAPVYFSSLGCEIDAIRPTNDPRRPYQNPTEKQLDDWADYLYEMTNE